MHVHAIGALMVVVLAASSAGVWATTYYVNGTCGNDGWSGTDPNCVSPNGPKATIQAGIDVASNGDTVIVAEATYYETIAVGGKSIVLRSDDPNDPNVVAATVIDANGANSPVVTFAGSEDPNTVLTGFTITGSDHYGNGGGIWGLDPNDPNNRAEATIAKCVITDNVVAIGYDGAGIAYCDGDILDCEIRDNIADHGGGLYRCDGQISNCLIVGNYVSEEGGGLYDCDGDLTGNVIVGNYTEYDGGGLYGCDGDISGCVIAGNYASYDGGGLALCSGQIRECTLSGNVGGFPGGAAYNCGDVTDCEITGNEAGGIAFEDVGGNRTVTRCVISGNRDGSGIWYDFDGAAARTLTLTDCVITENKYPGGYTLGGGVYYKYDNDDVDCDGTETGTLIVKNCTFRGNYAVYGGAIYAWALCSPVSVRISNTILYGDEASDETSGCTGQEVYVDTYCNRECVSYPTPSVWVKYSDVEDGNDGVCPYDPNIFTLWSNNIDEDPSYASVSGSTGNWSSDGSYDPNSFEVTFTDSSSSWTSDALVGKVINPDTAQDRRYVVLGNTSTTVTAWVDWPTFDDPNQESWVDSGDAYVILDYHLAANSPCIDTGTDSPTGGLSSEDIDKQPREMGTGVEIGADEYAVSLVSSEPPADGTLPKTQNNLIRLVFSDTITLPGGNALVIVELEDPNNDVSDDFTYALDPNDPNNCTLKAVENQAQLTDQTWYRVTRASGLPVDDFTLDVCTLRGDCNDSDRVTTADYSCVEEHLGEYTDERWDLNGSGRVTTTDYSVVKANLGHRKPDKP